MHVGFCCELFFRIVFESSVRTASWLNLQTLKIVLKAVKKIKLKINKNKTKVEISGLSPDYFQGRVWPDLWPRMASLWGLFFVCAIAGNLITC